MSHADGKIVPSPFVSGLNPYRTSVAESGSVLKLDTNEGPHPSKSLINELVSEGVDLIRSYPDLRELESLLAGMLEIDPSRVIVTAGADDALERSIRSVLGPGKELVLPVPTFEMLERFATLAGSDITEVEWTQAPYPLDAVLDAITDSTAMICVVTPNNPTGFTATAEDIETLSMKLPGVMILVDLAYIEFAEEDISLRVLELPNVIITRTLSKAWGLAGLRVGYAAGSERHIRWLRAAGQPYPVSTPSARLASRALHTGVESMRLFCDRIRKERDELVQLLKNSGVKVLPSGGNFVFARFNDAGEVQSSLRDRGILVRTFPGQNHLENGMRISLPGNEDDFRRLTRALEDILSI